MPRNERPTGPTATIIPDASRYAIAIRNTESARARSTIPAAYRTSEMTIGGRYPIRSASTPQIHSKRNMPRPNIESAMPISVGLARSWRSSSGTAISITPVASVEKMSAPIRAPLRLRIRDWAMGPA